MVLIGRCFIHASNTSDQHSFTSKYMWETMNQLHTSRNMMFLPPNLLSINFLQAFWIITATFESAVGLGIREVSSRQSRMIFPTAS
jgi:hypothetical protein